MKIIDKLYLSPEYSTLEELEADIAIYDATTLRQLADCPRKYQYSVLDGLKSGSGNKTVESRYLIAGRAIHEALDVLAVTGDEDEALTKLTEDWGDYDSNPCPENEAHLTHNLLTVVLHNYFDYIKTGPGSQFTPITLKYDDLNFDRLMGGKFRLLEDGSVLLSESSLLMRMTVDGDDFYYAGKPDQVVQNTAGNTYIMDHKTSSSYLSSWHVSQHRVSNQLRCYMGMMHELTGLDFHGGIVNAIYVGNKASSDTFKGTRFASYRYNWSQGHVEEALLNQLGWAGLIAHHEHMNYYPQASGMQCRSCNFSRLCEAEPEFRDGVIYTDYTQEGWRDFFTL